MAERFPARTRQLDRLLELDARGRLGQAYLFVGPDGSGKELTALELGRLLNCRDPRRCREEAACESCRKALDYQHPDLRWFCPAPASFGEAQTAELLAAKAADPLLRPLFARSGEVLLGNPEHPAPLTVRALLQFLRLRPYQGRRKVAVVDQAHRLRAGAANALLKMLEEPPADSVIILLSASREALLPTIQSRCLQVRFAPYGEPELAALLRELYDLDEDAARELARLGDGDARRAAELRQPEAQAMRRWGRQVLAAIARRQRGVCLVVAEQLHKGQLPEDVAEAAGVPRAGRQARELLERRERALRLCEVLQRGYREMLRCLLLGSAWEPASPEEGSLLSDLVAGRSPGGLLLDIEAVERVRQDLHRNLNIGLMMSVLFQELIRHAERDGAAVAT